MTAEPSTMTSDMQYCSTLSIYFINDTGSILVSELWLTDDHIRGLVVL